MTYYIAKQYTDAPGGRFIDDGPCSGEDFRENVLKKLMSECAQGERILIIFDGAYGYPTSFLEEAFGGLARLLGSKTVLDKFSFESNDEPEIVNRVNEYINGARQ